MFKKPTIGKISTCILSTLLAQVVFAESVKKEKAIDHKKMQGDVYHIAAGLMPFPLDFDQNDSYGWGFAGFTEFEAHNKTIIKGLTTDLHALMAGGNSVSISIGGIYDIGKFGDISLGYKLSRSKNNSDLSTVNTQTDLPEGGYFRYRSLPYDNFKIILNWHDGGDIYGYSSEAELNYMINDKLNIALNYEMVDDWGGNNLSKTSLRADMQITKNLLFSAGVVTSETAETNGNTKDDYSTILILDYML